MLSIGGDVEAVADIVHGTVIVAAAAGALSEPLASALVVVLTSIPTVELSSMK